jgi:ATP-dependent DNA helicase RecG
MGQRLLVRSGVTWDALALPAGVSGAQISGAAVHRFIRLARARRRRSWRMTDDPPARVLDNLRLTEGARLRHAAVLLFGDDPQALFPTAQVHHRPLCTRAPARYRPE